MKRKLEEGREAGTFIEVKKALNRY